MTRLIVLVMLALSAAALPAADYDFTLPPLQLNGAYTSTGTTSGSFSPILLPCGPTGGLITPVSGGIGQTFYNGTSGNLMNPPEAIDNAQGKVALFLFGDPTDQIATFVYSDIPIDPLAIGGDSNPNRRYGLCSIRIDDTNVAGSPGVLDVFVTDTATGRKVTGATVKYAGVSLSASDEVGVGQYRIVRTSNQSQVVEVSKSGYTTFTSPSPVVITMTEFHSLNVSLASTVPGTVTLFSNPTTPTTAANPIPLSIFFEKPVDASRNDFIISDITVTNGTVASLDGGPSEYLAQILPAGNGTVNVSVPANAVKDVTNTGNAASSVFTRTADNAGPSVTIDQAPGQSDPASTYPVRFAIHFSSAVTGFSASAVQLDGTAAPPIYRALTGSGQDYVLELSGMSAPGSIIATVPADAAVSATGSHRSKASTSSDNAVAWALADNYTLPTIIAPALRFAAPFPSADTQLVTIAAGARVVTLPRDNFTRLNQVSGAGGTLAGEITAAETALSDASGRFRYGSSNQGTSGNPPDSVDFFTYALTPAGTTNRQFGYVHLTLIDVSDAATTVGGTYVTLTNSSNGAKISGAALTFGISDSEAKPFSEMTNGVYRYLINNTEVGFIRIRATGFQDYTDATQRTLAVGSFPTTPVALTQTSLVATITSSVPEPTRSRAIPLTFTFSTAVSDFTAGDVVVRNGALSGFSGSGNTYTAILTPRKPGAVRVEIPSGAANASGQASNSVVFARTYDTTGPTVTINQAGGQADPAIAGPFTFTAQFSQPVTGFSGADVSFTGSTATGTLVANVTGSGQTYTISVSGMVGNGTVVASLVADAGLVNGHPSAASTSTDNTVTFTPPGVGSPSVTIDQDAGQPDPTSTNAVLFRVRFSDPVSNFTAGDVLLSGTAPGTLSASLSSVGTGGDEFLVLVGGMTGAGTVIAALPAGAATAQAGSQPTFAATSSDNQVTYAPAGGSGDGPSAASGGGACGLGSGLAALLAACALTVLARRPLR